MKLLPGAALLSALVASLAHAQSFPAKPLRIVAPSTTGGAVDLFPRMLAPKLGEGFGQSVIVENRAGGGGVLGAELVARSAPDGYTVLSGTTSQMISVPLLQKNVPYDSYRDFTPLAAMVEPVEFVMVRSTLPVGSLRELVEHARKEPGKLSYGGSVAGAYHHLVGEAMKMATGTNILHVPYKSMAQASPEVVAGRIDMTFVTLPVSRPFIGGGKAKLVASLGKDRYPGLPEVQGVGELYPAFAKPPAWFGFWGPAGVPQPIVSRWNAELVKAMNAPEMKAWAETNGMVVYASTPQRLTEMMKEGTEVYRKIIDTVGIKPE